MKFSTSIFVATLIICNLFIPLTHASETLTITVNNQSSDPVEYAVISAFVQNDHNEPELSPPTLVIDQVDKEFIAHVTPIQKGTAIEFPNHDQIRHHVYSFSPAKNFEIPLYKGLPAKPIVFEKAGVVSLGCNIHDWMSAYIYVVDTPYFAMTDKNGQASMALPPGEYEIQYWHPNIDTKSGKATQMIQLTDGATQAISTQLSLKQSWSFRRGPLSLNNRGRYR